LALDQSFELGRERISIRESKEEIPMDVLGKELVSGCGSWEDDPAHDSSDGEGFEAVRREFGKKLRDRDGKGNKMQSTNRHIDKYYEKYSMSKEIDI
jgi:hypothetical protein